MLVPGHTNPNERWQRVQSGKRSGYWSSAHVGEVPTFADGSASSPKCTVCSGAATVTCSRCQGKGTGVCSGGREGKKVVPASWSAFDHPKMKERPRKFQMKDGQTLVGRKVMVTSDTVTLRTVDGDVKVNSADIVSETAQPTTR